MKAWPLLGITIIQFILLLAHYFLFRTWIFFWPGLSAAGVSDLRIVLLILAFTFAPAAVLSFRYANPILRLIYNTAVLWLGLLNYLFLSAVLSWPVWGVLRLSGITSPNLRPWVSGSLTIAALLATVFGLLNARIVRVRRQTVRLPNLPESWRGRRAVHDERSAPGQRKRSSLQPPYGEMASGLTPDIVFLPGDLFDGVQGRSGLAA